MISYLAIPLTSNNFRKIFTCTILYLYYKGSVIKNDSKARRHDVTTACKELLKIGMHKSGIHVTLYATPPRSLPIWIRMRADSCWQVQACLHRKAPSFREVQSSSFHTSTPHAPPRGRKRADPQGRKLAWPTGGKSSALVTYRVGFIDFSVITFCFVTRGCISRTWWIFLLCMISVFPIRTMSEYVIWISSLISK